jgi:predicted CopG family antitoxin
VTKPVQLSDEAYRRLRARKKAGESFSDVVLRLTGRGSLSRLRGLRPAAEIELAAQSIAAIDRLDRPRRRGRR